MNLNIFINNIKLKYKLKKISMISKNLYKIVRNCSNFSIKNLNNNYLREESIYDLYGFNNLIGRGGFGSVYEGYIKTDLNKKVAIKRIDRYINENEVPELDILHYLYNFRNNPDSRFIMNILDSLKCNGKTYIISDLYIGGDLYDRITSLRKRKFSESSVCIIMEQIFRGLLYLHTNNVIHRDIKPENIVFRNQGSNLDIVIIDLGMSSKITGGIHSKQKFVDDRIMASSCYISPESFNGYYNSSSDIWSAGVIMYILLSGEHPFYNKSFSVTKSNIKQSKYRIESRKWDKISNSSKDLLKSIFEINPEKRIDIESILSHECFTNLK